ncbi:NAD dependent epimerase/dehydratase family protein [alpha proteobacterium HIMB5]|nr:NAD dependent epimerase/dehydratase family protein [alpha proteobacterium HIMB5]
MCDLLDKKKLEKIVTNLNPYAIVHLAAQSTVNENINKKIYNQDNVVATRNILNLMSKLKIKNIIFSSTAAIYDKKNNKIKETDKKKPISSYGKSKLRAENQLKRNKKINFVILRFFNVSSCLTNPLIGEYHNPETHLIPISVFKAMKNSTINLFGNDYPTPDGTCIRDYIHVKDICSVIKRSIRFFSKEKNLIINIGNGRGISNKIIVQNIQKILKKKLKVKFLLRRIGDHPSLVCDITKAKKTLNWRPQNSNVKKIIKDEIKWANYLIKKNLIRKFINVQK